MSPALAGKRIVVTRARSQSASLVAALETQGAEVVLLPAIAVVAPESFASLDAALKNIDGYDWLVLSSANTVAALVSRACELGVGDLSGWRWKIAAIGPATAEAAQRAGFNIDIVPAQHVAEALAASLRDRVRGSRVFYPRAEAARDVIPRELRAAGAEVCAADAYRTVAPEGSVARLRQMTAPPDAVVFTSSSTVRNFVKLLDRAGIERSAAWHAISIGPITTETLREFGWEPARESPEATVAGLVQSCIKLLGEPAAS